MRWLLIILLFSCKKETIIIEPVYKHVILLAFNGGFDSGWNKTFDPTTLNRYQIDSIIDLVKEDFHQFNVVITDNENIFYKATGLKQRVFITDTLAGMSTWIIDGVRKCFGGWAVIGSITNPKKYAAMAFAYKLGYKSQGIAGAVSHEIGHSIGLQHQFNNEPALMGRQSANPLAGWVTGINEIGKEQNDTMFINHTLE